ncbi:MAG: prolyl oligopeptidase family serine peptidase [Ignavibacteriaceae bacterium]
MKFFRACIIIILLFSANYIYSQNIPITKLFYPKVDFEFKLSPNGDYMAAIKKFPNGFTILITDIKKAAVYQQIPLGNGRVYNLNWISENRISYEQLGILYAINIDGTERQQLMSLWKDGEPHSIYDYDFIKNLQSTKMLNVLPNDFEHILVETRGVKSYPIIYQLDIFTGDKKEIANGDDDDINEWLVDRKGNVRFGIKNDDDKFEFYKRNEEGSWESENDLKLDYDGKSYINQKIRFLDFGYTDNIIYLASSAKSPRWRILKYDLDKKAVIDTVLQDMKYDIGNPINSDTKLLFLDSKKELAGIRYERDKPYTEWFDSIFKAYQDTLSKYYPGYFVDIFDWNKDASVVLVNLYSDRDPGNIMIYDSKTKKQEFYASFANDLLNYNLSKTKIIKYKTRDGYELEGYLNMPVNVESKSPLIVMPHGGPYDRDYWRYNPVIQFFCNQGYAVLRVNFRGSIGYGIDHFLQGVKKISSVMINDIADGAKWAIDNNYADSSKVFLYGQSYGGYAAIQSVILYPQIYKAAVCIAAPTDIVELLDYFDDQDNEFNYEFWKTTVGDPDDEEDYLESISPIYNIKKIKRPIFLFHGEKDQIVPVSQTKDFIDAAEDLGIKIDYKIIKDEDHYISENRNMEYILKKSVEFYKDNSNNK